MGDDYTKIAPAFVKACAALQAATKNSRNAHLGNSYADLESVQTAARDALAPNGLAWFQEVVREESRIGVHTRIIHTSGQILDCGRCLITVPGNSRNLAHAEGAALSYARRYGLAAAVGIHQADPDASPVDTPAPKRAPAKPKPKPKAPPKAAKPDPDLEALGLTVEQVDRWLSTKGDAWANLTPTRKKNALKWLADNADEVRGK
tara:strand:+ start:3640 stop:4254 length:615 start_codon:yes stop_codon:yes gene_type:complete